MQTHKYLLTYLLYTYVLQCVKQYDNATKENEGTGKTDLHVTEDRKKML